VNGPEFGERVTFTRTLTRRYRHHPSNGWQGRKVWESEGYPGEPEPAPRSGIIVGVRTLADGVNSYNGYEEPITFQAERHFKAYLIAFDFRRKPALVLPEHIERKP
jgi:hypothetical protein